MLKQYLIIFFVSMVPLIELRGAIPISQGFQLPFLPSYIVCIIGNMLPVPIIYLFARKVLEWGADYFWHCFCLWESPSPAQGPGRELWRQVFWIWILSPVLPL